MVVLGCGNQTNLCLLLLVVSRPDHTSANGVSLRPIKLFFPPPASSLSRCSFSRYSPVSCYHGVQIFAQVHYSVSQRVEFVSLLMNTQRARTNSPSNAALERRGSRTNAPVRVLLAHMLGKMTRVQRYNPAH